MQSMKHLAFDLFTKNGKKCTNSSNIFYRSRLLLFLFGLMMLSKAGEGSDWLLDVLETSIASATLIVVDKISVNCSSIKLNFTIFESIKQFKICLLQLTDSFRQIFNKIFDWRGHFS